MPQPLRDPKASTNWAPYALDNRPALAAAIGRVAAVWATMEARMAMILGEAFQHEADRALDMITAIVDIHLRMEQLGVALSPLFTDELREEFEGLQKEVRSRARERGRIIHGVWGVSAELPDKLLRLDAKVYANFVGRSYAEAYPDHAGMRASIEVWSAPCFDAAIQRIRDLDTRLGRFQKSIVQQRDMPRPAREQTFVRGRVISAAPENPESDPRGAGRSALRRES